MWKVVSEVILMLIITPNAVRIQERYITYIHASLEVTAFRRVSINTYTYVVRTIGVGGIWGYNLPPQQARTLLGPPALGDWVNILTPPGQQFSSHKKFSLLIRYVKSPRERPR